MNTKSVSIFFLIMIIVFNYSCKKDELDSSLIFSGKIESPNSDTLNILNKNQEIIESIILNKDKTFIDTLNLSKGFYSFTNGKESTKVFLKPNYDLSLSLNTKEFDESIKYEGKGANENNYLAKKSLLEESFGDLNYYGFYGKLSESEFLKLTDSLYNLQKDLLVKSVDLDKDFFFIESKSIEFEKLNKISTYENLHRFVTGNKEFKVSENYPNAFKNVDLSNESLLISPNYLSYIQSYLRKLSNDRMAENDDNFDPTLEYVKTIRKEVNSDIIKEELLYDVGKWELNYTKKLDSVFNIISLALTNDRYLSEVTVKYKELKKTEKGAISPVFELNDIYGKSISLNDFKGKLVYIDIWATWCLPCIIEMPYLKKMKNYFKGKNIQIISICKDDSEKNWRKMVEEKELGGIQVFAPDNGISFFKDYSVQGIPRFILIDKDGKIIDANAKKPSDPELQKEIEEYL
ncbi:TlpA family protein disulfide reductase [Psychroflexus tropicus]|uniref:TlpA family protein disulfide reductase n=1 Tax=Psychroflexus tropicus TaxID=197345 RepID=UPI00037D5AB1|nr:TlpA disulfide reductase family protein [Psychroflexus tropicus]